MRPPDHSGLTHQGPFQLWDVTSFLTPGLPAGLEGGTGSEGGGGLVSEVCPGLPVTSGPP